MSDLCPHDHQFEVRDQPIADPESYEFLGRFDVVTCVDCNEVLSQEPTTHPQPE